MLDHPGAIRVPTGAPKWPKTAQKWPRMAQNHQNGSKWHCMTPNGPNDPKTPWVYKYYMSCWTTLDSFQRPTGALHDQKWAFITQNGPALLQMALKHFSLVYYMILCPAGPPWGLFRGPQGPQNCPKQHRNVPL